MLDIVPTRTLFAATNQALATGYYHWFFLIQPEPLPERMIGADPLFYLHTSWANGRRQGHAAGSTRRPWPSTSAAFADPATIHASCEDYRAAATIDLATTRRTSSAASPARCWCCGASAG